MLLSHKKELIKQIRSRTHYSKREHTPRGVVEYLSKNILERTNSGVWTLVGWFGGESKEAEVLVLVLPNSGSNSVTGYLINFICREGKLEER